MARLGILLSGSGSTYANLVSRLARDAPGVEVALVVASRPDAGGVALAADFGHPTTITRDPVAVTEALHSRGVEWVAMCGWMHFWDPPGAFASRTLNIHPSLLPAFGGTGMYGLRVHQAVLASGCTLTGCTAHLVTGDYDSGPILAQRAVPVRLQDTPELLQARVQEAERELYPQVVAAACAGGLHRSARGWWLDLPEGRRP